MNTIAPSYTIQVRYKDQSLTQRMDQASRELGYPSRNAFLLHTIEQAVEDALKEKENSNGNDH